MSTDIDWYIFDAMTGEGEDGPYGSEAAALAVLDGAEDGYVARGYLDSEVEIVEYEEDGDAMDIAWERQSEWMERDR